MGLLLGGLLVIRNWIKNFMTGRYGPDHLGVALMLASIVVSLLSNIPFLSLLFILSYAFLIIAFFRMLSKNITKRRAENDKFLKFWWPVKRKFKLRYEQIKNRKTYKFFRCHSCKNILRVPRGKGKIQITCPKCGERVIKKT